MGKLVPDKSRIERGAVERIIRRATELQAGERDLGDGLTEQELLRLGEEVGIPAAYLYQALLEERTQSIAAAEPGILAWLTGPRQVTAQRAIPGGAARVREALGQWMADGELLTVKRRYPHQTSWEARQDVFSSLKREFSFSGRAYRLAKAKEVAGQVARLDEDRCHVQLVADLSNTRRTHLTGGATLGGAGAIATAIGLTLGVAAPVALIPLGLGLLVGYSVARRRRAQLERVHVALEQVLDRLEHGEIEVQPKGVKHRPSALARIADEIKKSLGAMS